MTDLATTSNCRSWSTSEPYEGCDCPAHDFVAEMLGLVSTTGKDFRPQAARAKAYESVHVNALEQLDMIRDLTAKIEDLEAKKRFKEEAAEVSRRLMRENLRKQSPIVLGEGMIVDYAPKCGSCGSSHGAVHAIHGRPNAPLEAVCGACHSNYHDFTSVRAYNGASPGPGACL